MNIQKDIFVPYFTQDELDAWKAEHPEVTDPMDVPAISTDSSQAWVESLRMASLVSEPYQRLQGVELINSSPKGWKFRVNLFYR